MFYAVISFILGGLSDQGGDSIGIDHDIDIGVSVDADGIEVDGDFDIGADAPPDMDIAAGAEADPAADVQLSDAPDTAGSPSPFSPLVLASAITTFGAVGLISMKGFGLSGLASTFVALGFAGAMGAAIFYGIVKFMYGSQSNSVFSLEDLVGYEAEVITSVPTKGLGEIAYTVKGVRGTLSARSLEGTEIRRGAVVIIREIAGNAAVVQQKLTIDDVELSDGTLKQAEK